MQPGTFYVGNIVRNLLVFAVLFVVKLDASLPITSICSLAVLPDYQSLASNDCPYCKQGTLVNGYGYSKLQPHWHSEINKPAYESFAGWFVFLQCRVGQ